MIPRRISARSRSTDRSNRVADFSQRSSFWSDLLVRVEAVERRASRLVDYRGLNLVGRFPHQPLDLLSSSAGATQMPISGSSVNESLHLRARWSVASGSFAPRGAYSGKVRRGPGRRGTLRGAKAYVRCKPARIQWLVTGSPARPAGSFTPI